MHNFLSFIKEFRIPKKQALTDALASFSKRRFSVFIALSLIACVTMVIVVEKINTSFMVTVPADGGTLKEGIIGMPTLVNPVLAVSDADKDITALVYSGLMRKMPDGTFVPDLAESYTISPDGKTYTFILKSTATFHDGTPVTADDVLFTVEKIKDPLIKSPRHLGWDGASIEKTDDKTVVFTLKQPYISFMDNTTIGILPQHIWKDISATEFGLSTLNIKAIGSGPYQITSVSKNKDGIPEQYKLSRFADFTLGMPHIKNIRLISFANEKDLVHALLSHSIDQASGLSPENAKDITDEGYTMHTATLPRIFGLFFNTANNKVLADPAVIRALNTALDRQAIVDDVLDSYGTTVNNPVPDTILPAAGTTSASSIADAQAILDHAGWVAGADGMRAKGSTKTVTTTKKVGKKTVTTTSQVPTGASTRLAFSITTGDTPELNHAAELIKGQLEAIGVQVDIKVYGTGELNQLIRSRNYEALFFGQIVNHESDLYAFWHSSQVSDPGLNIALYKSPKADVILQSAQNTLDGDKRLGLYRDFVAQFNADLPALLIYSPKYLYATEKDLSNVSFDTLSIPSDRFTTIYSWYADTDHVWKIFTKNNN